MSSTQDVVLGAMALNTPRRKDKMKKKKKRTCSPAKKRLHIFIE
jgi:hypothetical protein